MKFKMSKQYYAIKRDTPKDSLKHWKYIRREKKNGKWRYYYDDPKKENKKTDDKMSGKDLIEAGKEYLSAFNNYASESLDNLKSYAESADTASKLESYMKSELYMRNLVESDNFDKLPTEVQNAIRKKHRKLFEHDDRYSRKMVNSPNFNKLPTEVQNKILKKEKNRSALNKLFGVR